MSMCRVEWGEERRSSSDGRNAKRLLLCWLLFVWEK